MSKIEQRIRSLTAAAAETDRTNAADRDAGRGSVTAPEELRQRQRSMINALLCCMI